MKIYTKKIKNKKRRVECETKQECKSLEMKTSEGDNLINKHLKTQ
jgi:hypothetical protein